MILFCLKTPNTRFEAILSFGCARFIPIFYVEFYQRLPDGIKSSYSPEIDPWGFESRGLRWIGKGKKSRIRESNSHNISTVGRNLNIFAKHISSLKFKSEITVQALEWNFQ